MKYSIKQNIAIFHTVGFKQSGLRLGLKNYSYPNYRVVILKTSVFLKYANNACKERIKATDFENGSDNYDLQKIGGLLMQIARLRNRVFELGKLSPQFEEAKHGQMGIQPKKINNLEVFAGLTRTSIALKLGLEYIPILVQENHIEALSSLNIFDESFGQPKVEELFDENSATYKGHHDSNNSFITEKFFLEQV